MARSALRSHFGSSALVRTRGAMRPAWLLLQCSALLRGPQLTELAASRRGKGKRIGPLSPPLVNPLLPVSNPYLPDIPTGIVAELYPVAPKDAVAPPSDGVGIYGPLDRSAVVDQMAWRSSFPGETPDAAPGLAGRWLVAQPDRTDVPPPLSAPVPMPGPKPEDFSINPPVAQATEDKVPAVYGRYFNQNYHRELARLDEARLQGEISRVDTDGDGGVTAQEFELEMHDRQHRSVADKETLFDKYKDANNVITTTNFKRLAATGYAPLNMVPLPIKSSASETGFWGTQWKCPENQVATGARLEVATWTPGADNTMVNGVELTCKSISGAGGPAPAGGGTDQYQTAEGKFGDFHDGACADGEAIDGARVRLLPYLPTQDNLGVTDVLFTCRSRDLTQRTNFTFAYPPPPKDAALGGWDAVQYCATGEFVCSVQTRVDPYGPDKMGVTTVGFGCCGGSADCTAVCSHSSVHDITPECKACKAALKGA